MIELSLLEQLENRTSKYTPSNTGWYQFIVDHKRELLNASYIQDIQPEIAFKYRYRPKELLNHYEINTALTWIILLLNDIDGEKDFSGIKKLFVPAGSETITDLYEQYVNYQEQLKNSDKELVE